MRVSEPWILERPLFQGPINLVQWQTHLGVKSCVDDFSYAVETCHDN